MRIFVDCEFNGFGGELISMALVPEDDDVQPWYEVRQLPEGNSFAWDKWVWDNVVPYLCKRAIGRDEFRASAIAWLQQFDNPTIIADWYTDLIHFFGIFAGKDHTDSVGYACNAELVLIDCYSSTIPHNALHDAMAIRDAYFAHQATPTPENGNGK